MKPKKIKLKLSKIINGWVNGIFFIDDKEVFKFRGSEVYDPLYEIPSLLTSLKEGKAYTWEINQEGSMVYIVFLPTKKDKILISFINSSEILDSSVLLNRKKVISAIEKSLIKLFTKNFKKKKKKKSNGFYIDPEHYKDAIGLKT